MSPMKDVGDCEKHKSGNILIERLQLVFLFAEDVDLREEYLPHSHKALESAPNTTENQAKC